MSDAVLWKYSLAVASSLALSVVAAGPAAAHVAAPAAPMTWMITDQVAAEDAGPASNASEDWFDPWAVITSGNAVITTAT